jgi:hypothetical protein
VWDQIASEKSLPPIPGAQADNMDTAIHNGSGDFHSPALVNQFLNCPGFSVKKMCFNDFC